MRLLFSYGIFYSFLAKVCRFFLFQGTFDKLFSSFQVSSLKKTNVALIKSQKAELEELHQKIEQLNRENEEKSAKLDELEIRLGLTKVTLSDEEKTAKIASLEKRIKTFVTENIKLKEQNQKLKDGCINQREALTAAKSKISDLKEKNEELLSDNRTLS